MRRVIIAAAVIGLLSGCNALKRSQHRAQAYERWTNARARVITGLAEEHHKAGDLDKARQSATEAVQLDETYVPALVLLSKVLIEQGHYDKAVEELRIAEVLQTNSAEVAYLLGVAFEKRGDHDQAMKHYRKARALDPGSDAYVAAAAEVLVATGQPARALEIIQAQLDRRDCGAGMHALAGELATMLGLHKRAATYFQDCLDAEPGHPEAREGLAKAHYFAGRHAEAVDALTDLVARPGYKDKASWVYVMLGECHLTLNRPGLARDAFRTAAKIDPTGAKTWNALAKASLALGDVPGAMAASRKAMVLGAAGPETTIVLAYGLMRQGRSLDAIKVLDAAAQDPRADPTVLCMLGRCYDTLGRTGQATSCYHQALRNDPANSLAKSLLSMTGRRGPGTP